MSGGIFDAALNLMHAKGDIIEKVDASTPKVLNVISGFFRGNVPAPVMAENVYIYFVRKVDGANNFVGGFIATECDKILTNLREDYNYVIFVPDNLPEYGISHIASGRTLYKKYCKATEDELRDIVEKDSKHTYLATDKDLELLKLRLEILGVGKVYTKLELETIINRYTECAGVCTLDKTALSYQAVIDIAISAIKK